MPGSPPSLLLRLLQNSNRFASRFLSTPHYWCLTSSSALLTMVSNSCASCGIKRCRNGQRFSNPSRFDFFSVSSPASHYITTFDDALCHGNHTPSCLHLRLRWSGQRFHSQSLTIVSSIYRIFLFVTDDGRSKTMWLAHKRREICCSGEALPQQQSAASV